jgi:hypothetical protein
MLMYFRAAIAVLLAGSALAASAQGQDTTVGGEISALSGMTLTLTLADNSLKTVNLLPETLVLAREAALLEAIQPNEALGVAARREADGSLTASSINIFPPQLWSRVRKGQFPMQSGDLMTNALVIENALAVQGRVLRLRYEALVTEINVPEGIRITRILTERIADLKEGSRVLIRGTASSDGSLTAGSVTYELAP